MDLGDPVLTQDLDLAVIPMGAFLVVAEVAAVAVVDNAVSCALGFCYF